MISVILHETVHYGDWQDGSTEDNEDYDKKIVPLEDGPAKLPRWLKQSFVGDKGHYFETDVYNQGNDKKGPIENLNDAAAVEKRQKTTEDKERILPTLPIVIY